MEDIFYPVARRNNIRPLHVLERGDCCRHTVINNNNTVAVAFAPPSRLIGRPKSLAVCQRLVPKHVIAHHGLDKQSKYDDLNKICP